MQIKNIYKIISLDTPVLGICFGHQVLAEVLGGKVVKNEYFLWRVN